jgi:MFS family permease
VKPAIRFLLVSNYLNLLGFGLFSPLYALYAQHIGATPFQTGAAWSVYTALQGVLIICFGRMEDKFGDKRKLVVFGYFWLAFASLLFLLVDSPSALFVVLAVNAIGTSILFPSWKYIYTKNEDIGKEASEWSLFDGGNMLCYAAAALASGTLINLYGFRSIFIAMFFIQIIAAVLSMRLLKLSTD